MTITLYFKRPAEPRLIAMGIRQHLAATSSATCTRDGDDLCARMFGYADWRHLMANVGVRPPSQPDADVTADELHVRVPQYLFAAERHGLTLDEAWKLISDVTVGGWLGVGRFMGEPAWH